jgi:hypothetical protein
VFCNKIQEVIDVPDITRESVKAVNDNHIDLFAGNGFYKILESISIGIFSAGDIFSDVVNSPIFGLTVFSAFRFLIFQGLMIIISLFIATYPTIDKSLHQVTSLGGLDASLT